jgi:hypothetical protein
VNRNNLFPRADIPIRKGSYGAAGKSEVKEPKAWYNAVANQERRREGSSKEKRTFAVSACPIRTEFYGAKNKYKKCK